MARHVSEAQRRAQDGSWTVDGLPWVNATATSPREALEAARAAIAEWLEVEPESFDLGT